MLLLATIWGYVTEVNTLPAQPNEVPHPLHVTGTAHPSPHVL